MLIDDIETYLTGFAPFIASDVTFVLRRGLMPETPDAVIVLRESRMGKPDVRGMGASIGSPLLERPGLEVVVRGPRKNYLAARDVAEAVHIKLCHAGALTISGRRYAYIQALLTPAFSEQDLEARCEFIASYVVWKERG